MKGAYCYPKVVILLMKGTFGIYFSFLGISPSLLGTCLVLIHISPPLESNHLKDLAPKRSCKTIYLQRRLVA